MKQPIPDKLFFKIGEVAEIAEVEQHVLRYWEEEFDVLKPNKNRSGQRLYQKKDIDQVLEIKQLLYADKFTIAGANRSRMTIRNSSLPRSRMRNFARLRRRWNAQGNQNNSSARSSMTTE